MNSEPDSGNPRNSLYNLAAIGGALLGLFLIIAAHGHLWAVWPDINSGKSASGSSRLVLILPGLILATIGLMNIAIFRVLWVGMNWALHLALIINVLAAAYFTYLLLGQSAPGHPIGQFVATMCSYIILLMAIRVGLVWPARVSTAQANR